MVKAGQEYEEIVAIVRRAFDPGAEVSVGSQVNGPDGQRDMDVRVLGRKGGTQHLIMIECKDHKKRIDIQAIDALNDKRHDLQPDCTIIYSNSGFTKRALHKAARVGIQTASALKRGDARIRHTVLDQPFCFLCTYPMAYRITAYTEQNRAPLPEENWPTDELMRNGLPVHNWVSSECTRLLGSNPNAIELLASYWLKGGSEFVLSGQPITLSGLQIQYDLERKWKGQLVQADATMGHYDHQLRRIMVANNEASLFALRIADWYDVDMPQWSVIQVGPDGPHLGSYGYLSGVIAPVPGSGSPDIDGLIDKSWPIVRQVDPFAADPPQRWHLQQGNQLILGTPSTSQSRPTTVAAWTNLRLCWKNLG